MVSASWSVARGESARSRPVSSKRNATTAASAARIEPWSQDNERFAEEDCRRNDGGRDPCLRRFGRGAGLRWSRLGGYHHHYGWGPYAAVGVLGLAAGAAIAANNDDCTRYQPIYDRWGNYIGNRPVNVCY